MRQLNKLVVKFRSKEERNAVDTVARLFNQTAREYVRDVVVRDLIRIDKLLKDKKAEADAQKQADANTSGDSSGAATGSNDSGQILADTGTQVDTTQGTGT